MSKNILLVDDEFQIPQGIRDLLEDETDFFVELASSGEAALETMTRFAPDVCIVDMRLPGLNGNEFILRAHSLCPGARFLIHTGSIDYVLPDELRAIGMDAGNVIAKPVQDLSIFITKINTLS
jgi:CheY-like chemotaxis protein